MLPPEECPNCKLAQRKIASLEARLTRLETELRESKRQATPFSRQGKSKKKRKGKPGRKKGEGTFRNRETPSEEEIDQTHEVPLDQCPECSGGLTDRKTHTTYQQDIEFKVVTSRFVTHSGYCPCCDKRVRSRHPEQTSSATGAAGTCLGANAKTLAAQLKHQAGMSFEKIAALLNSFGLRVTPSGLCQSNARLAVKAKGIYEALIEALRASCCVGADETGWRIGPLSAWLWVFTQEEITVFTIDRSRGHQVVLKILGREFKGILHADCFLAYDHKALKHWLQQKCFAHFLKDLARMEEEKTAGAVRFPRAVAEVLRDAIALRDEKPNLTSRQVARRRNKIERRLDVLIDEKRRFSDQDNRRFAARLRKQREHLFRFLDHDEAETTNNRSERMIRPAVIVRKTGGCNKTEKGAQTHSILASILATARQQGRNIFNFLHRLVTDPDPPSDLLLPKNTDA